jgi:hypothetical protein
MADRVSVAVTIGGELTAAQFRALTALIQIEGLSIEWDGAPFEPGDRAEGEPLRLFAHEVAGGRVEPVEDWCVANKVPFARWSGGNAGSWGPERVVYGGAGSPASFTADEEDRILVDRMTVEQLGSVEAVLGHFDAADFVIPPLVVTGNP